MRATSSKSSIDPPYNDNQLTRFANKAEEDKFWDELEEERIKHDPNLAFDTYHKQRGTFALGEMVDELFTKFRRELIAELDERMAARSQSQQQKKREATKEIS